MSVLLLAGLLGSVLVFLMVVTFCLRGEFRRAGQTARRWGVFAVAYAATLVVTAATPRDFALKTGAPYGDDDMCISIASVNRTPEQAGDPTDLI